MSNKYFFYFIIIFFKLINSEDENIIKARCIFIIDYSKVLDFHLVNIEKK